MALLDRIRRRLPDRWSAPRPLVPLVTISGPIGVVTPLRPGVTLAALAGALERAFRMRRAVGVAIIVNSPGGSPVQSRLIYGRIRALAERHGKPVLVFIEDVGASGGYLVALAGDEIVADESSIVGSIGVVSAGFGFNRLLERAGIDRRVYATGERKSMLDPFRPEDPQDVERLKALQNDVQDMFTSLVKERRGGSLHGDDGLLFSGEFWSGRKALDLGLVDRLGDLRSTLEQRFGERVRIVKVPARSGGWLKRFVPFGGAAPQAVPLADDLVSAIETRALWSRFGL